MKVKVEVSARHVHLCENDIYSLFGKGLTIKRELSQPGQFLSNEKVTIKNGDRIIENVSVLGPARKESQVEISATDSRNMRINAPVRESGNLLGSPGCIIYGPNGKINLEYGVIIAKRHIHVNKSDDAAKIFKNGEECSVKIETSDRTLILCKTIIRIADNFKFACHIDTDESNAAGISGVISGEILKL